MLESTPTTGAIQTSDACKKQLAKESLAHNLAQPGFVARFPHMKAKAQEGTSGPTLTPAAAVAVGEGELTAADHMAKADEVLPSFHAPFPELLQPCQSSPTLAPPADLSPPLPVLANPATPSPALSNPPMLSTHPVWRSPTLPNPSKRFPTTAQPSNLQPPGVHLLDALLPTGMRTSLHYSASAHTPRINAHAWSMLDMHGRPLSAAQSPCAPSNLPQPSPTLQVYTAGDIKGADGLYSLALGLSPDPAVAAHCHSRRATCRLALEDSEGALSDCMALLSLDSVPPDVDRCAGACLVKLGRLPEARERLQRAQAAGADVTNELAHLERGEVALGEMEAAGDDCGAALHLTKVPISSALSAVFQVSIDSSLPAVGQLLCQLPINRPSSPVKSASKSTMKFPWTQCSLSAPFQICTVLGSTPSTVCRFFFFVDCFCMSSFFAFSIQPS